MDDLISLSKTYHECKDAKCWTCGRGEVATKTPESAAGVSEETAGSCDEVLKKCGACKMARYCSKDCQTRHWKEGHKRTCKAMPVFIKLTKINYSKYDITALLGPAHFIPGLSKNI